MSKKLEALKMTKAPKALTCSAVAMSGGHASHFGGMSALTILSALVIFSATWPAAMERQGLFLHRLGHAKFGMP